MTEQEGYPTTNRRRRSNSKEVSDCASPAVAYNLRIQLHQPPRLPLAILPTPSVWLPHDI